MLLRNGDYVPDGKGGFLCAAGSEALLEEVLFRLTARRGAFPLMPELGSNLFSLSKGKKEARELLAIQFAQEALAGIDHLEISTASLDEKQGLLVFQLLWKGTPLSVTWKG